MTQPNTSAQSALTPNELSRSLKGRHLTMISIGGIIGAGLFVSSSTSIIAGGPASFISYAICGLLILLIMRMLGEMTTALPKVRSFTEFARAGLGEGAGFVVGWLYWYFWVLVVPVEAIAGAKILHHWLPQFSPLQIGIGLMSVMTAVNLMSARSYAEFEFWFASIKVAAIIVFIVIAASFAFGFTSPHGSTFANLVDHGGFTPNGWKAVLAAVPTVFFAMTGAEITTIAAAESAQPGRAVARMSTTVILRILFFYVISLFLIVSVTPWDTVRSGESPFTLALNTMHVPLRAQHHEHHHSHRGAVLLEFCVLCELAGHVHPGRPRRCAAGAGEIECQARARGLGDDGRGCGFFGHHRRHSSAASRIRFSGQYAVADKVSEHIQNPSSFLIADQIKHIFPVVVIEPDKIFFIITSPQIIQHTVVTMFICCIMTMFMF
jgi:amino acid transporter